MYKYSNIAIVISFFCLWLISFISANTEIILGFSFIFSFGILHGANDLQLIHQLNVKQNKISLKKTLIYYVIIVLVGVLSFYYLPFTALLCFVIISGYHFGEQQWQSLGQVNKKWFTIFFQFVYGTFILFLLFNFHLNEVQNIIFEISGVTVPVYMLILLLKIFGVLFALQILYLYIYVQNLRHEIILEVFHILVFSILFMSSNLIWGFTIYFIVWHSVPSILDQIKFLHKDVNFDNFKLYFKSAFIYWIASLAGISVLYWIFKDEKIFNALFFSFLAAITFPHVLVIIKMFDRKK